MRPALLTAYYTAMRKGEIDTKTREGRSIPLNPILTKMLHEIKVSYFDGFVFT
jgi:hypothetical protein